MATTKLFVVRRGDPHMEIRVLRDEMNPFLDRREIELEIVHEGGATPKRIEVFKEVVKRFSLDPDKTLLMYLKTIRGTNKSQALIYYYPNGIDWSTIEPPKRRKVIKLGEEEREAQG